MSLGCLSGSGSPHCGLRSWLVRGSPLPLALVTHVVEEVSPAFHGDALENSQHCKQDVVELSDPVVGPFPVGLAFGPIGAGAGGFLCPTWSRRLTLNVICEREGEERQEKEPGKKALRSRGPGRGDAVEKRKGKKRAIGTNLSILLKTNLTLAFLDLFIVFYFMNFFSKLYYFSYIF